MNWCTVLSVVIGSVVGSVLFNVVRRRREAAKWRRFEREYGADAVILAKQFGEHFALMISPDQRVEMVRWFHPAA